MANRPPIRPWSRLTSLRSVPAPESQPPSVPPTIKTNPTPPSKQPSQPSSQNGAAPFATSLKSSQERNTSSLDNNANSTKSLPTTTLSQKLKLITPPPSSKLNVNHETEPKIKVEEEKKTMLVNKITEKPSANGNGSLEKGHHKKLSDSEDSNIRIITISGENKGAYMEIIQSRKKPNSHHKMGNSKTKANDSESENPNRNDKKNHKVKTPSSLPRNGVYMNSNVQCVNNSLLFHTSCTSNDPGVHLTLSKKLHLEERVDGKRN